MRAVRLAHAEEFELVIEGRGGRLSLPRFVAQVGARDASHVLGDAIERLIAMLDDLDGDVDLEDDEPSDRILRGRAIPPYLRINDADCEPEGSTPSDWLCEVACSGIGSMLPPAIRRRQIAATRGACE
jgi:hypothetical protein